MKCKFDLEQRKINKFLDDKFKEKETENLKLKDEFAYIEIERQDRGIEIFRLYQEIEQLKNDNSKLKIETNIYNKKSNLNKENH